MGDLTKDLLLMSDFCDETTDIVNETNKILKKKKFKPSLYDFYGSDEDDEIQLKDSEETKKELVDNFQHPKCGRGRGYLIQKASGNKMVGSGNTFLDFQSDTTKSIRCVSNIDYSNDLLEKTFNTHNRKALNEQSYNCLGSATSVDKEIISEKPTSEIETPPLPLSELLKNCRKPKRHAKLKNISIISDEGRSVPNFKIETETNSKNDREDMLFDLQSQTEFPHLS